MSGRGRKRKMILKQLIVGLSVTFLLFGLASSVGTERVSPITTMTVPRAGHTATLLPDGTVLIAGGCIVNGCENKLTASAELYDPVTNGFQETGAMKVARVGHAAISLATGKILILGGWAGDNATAIAELYNPETKSFSIVGEMNEARDGFSATLLKDGRILIAGGYNGGMTRLTSAEIYNPKDNSFTLVGAMTTARMSHSATLSQDGRVLIVGGSQSRGDILSSSELFDPSTGTFSVSANLHIPRHKHAATLLEDGRVIVLGGAGAGDFSEQYASVEIFDTKTSSFYPISDMSAARFKIPDAVVRLESGEVLVVGSDERLELYDIKSKSFRTVLGKLDAERSYMTGTLLPDGNVLITGGYDDSIHISSQAWLYQPN